ncbi:MAG: Ig domain-containing protein [Spirochaetaceae bacterium]|nr:Ig domain-containing protein [Spirochaetaceae bacterium]
MKKAVCIFLGFIILILTGCSDVFGSYKNPIDPDNAVKVNSISLSLNTAVFVSGETLQLAHTLSPENATNKGVVWSSSDTEIADINSDGLISAVKPGSCVIEVKSADGSASAFCAVSVKCIVSFDSTGAAKLRASSLIKVKNWLNRKIL